MSFLDSLLPIAGGAALGGSLASGVAGGGKSGGASAGGGGGGQAPDLQSSNQSTTQTVTNNITVGDFGESTRNLLPLLLSAPPYPTVSGYSAEALLSGRASLTTYAIVGAALLAGLAVYKKVLR
jgi:hypothetical protein